MDNILNCRGPEELIKQIKKGTFYFNPLEILGIEQTKDARTMFRDKIKSKKITERIAVTLAFDQISTKESNRYLEVYNKKGYYKLNMQNYGKYEAALISDIEYLKESLKNNKNQQQEHQRTLLYTCCRSGFYDCVELLLHLGCDIEQKQNTNSTPLHVASYYGHENVIGLLISYGANNNIKNSYGHYPSDEARTDQVKQLILTCQDDKILPFFKQQKQEGLVECIQRSKDDNMIRIYRKVKSVDIQKLFKNKSEYCHCYHGTKFEYLKPILDVGLQPSGAKTKYGTVQTPNSHIAPDKTVAGIKNWAKAIFTSPSPFYAADAAYSGKIQSQNEDYRCLVEALIKLGSYKEYSSTVVNRFFNINNEPPGVEYRINCNQEDPLIQRTEDTAQVIVFSVLFLKQKYLMGQKNYDECLQFLGNCSAF